MDNPVISIIVPIYNAEKDLSRCLNSLINQTFNNIEIICVIDGSPDNSLNICKEYQSNEPRMVIVSQENRGVSEARNNGLVNAKGKYIQFCDPDDYYALDMCEKLYNAIFLSNADLAIVGIKVLYDQVPITVSDKEYFRIKGNGLTTINEYVTKNTDVSLCNKIFKKSIIDTYNINFPSKLHYEDACFCYKYFLISKTIYFVPEYIYTYVRHDNSIMSNTFQKTPWAIDHVKILEDVKKFMLKNNLNGIYEKDIFLWIVTVSVYFVLLHGLEQIFNSTMQIASDLIADIHDDYIKSCPFVFKNDRLKLLSLKNKDKKNIFRLDEGVQAKRKIMDKILLKLFPKGSWRRNILKKIRNKLKHNG